MAHTRIIELDGIRGLAALAVMIAHFFGEVPHGLRILTVGWIGVDVFFVLSGFLIGSYIFQEAGSSRFFSRFYLRRASRTLPVYFIVCSLCLLALQLTSAQPWSEESFSAWIYLVLGNNIAMSVYDSYGNAWLRPTWTLCVEEQFYLLAPLVITMIPRKWILRTLVFLCGMALVSRIIASGFNEVSVLTLLPCRMDLLLSGMVIAWLYRTKDLSKYLTILRIMPVIIVLLLLALIITLPAGILLVIKGSLIAAAIASFLLAIIMGAPEGVRYRSPVLRFFGQISYTLYLVHQPVSGLLHGLILDSFPDIATFEQVAVTLLSMVVSIGIAMTSWKWLEAPILHWARNYRFS